MADTNITKIDAVRNGKVLFSTASPTLSDTGDDAYLDVSDLDGSKVLFFVKQTGDSEETVDVKSGYYSAEGIGDFSFETTKGGGEYILGPFETARFKDSNGYINFRAGTTGSTSKINVRAVLLP